MIKLLAVFTVNLYLLLICAIAGNFTDLFSECAPAVLNFILFLIFLSLILAVINFICAVRKQINYEIVSFKKIYIFKLLFGIYNIISVVIIVMITAAGSNGIGALIIMIILLPSGMLADLAASAYSVSTVIILRREKILNTAKCLLHIILQLFFLLSFIDCVYLHFKFRQKIQF